MSENTTIADMLLSIVKDNNVSAKNAFDTAINDKLRSAIDTKRVQVAQTFLTGQSKDA